MTRVKPKSRKRSRVGKASRLSGLLPILLVAAGLGAYANSFAGAFLFDDAIHILDNQRIRQLWPPSEVIGGPRPVVDLTLAINYRLGGFEVEGYHAVNIAVHILAALTLYGLVRRTLLWEKFRGRYADTAPLFALVTSLVWVVHPLQTQSVTYLIQRAESLMGLFYLLTLYCAVRGFVSPRRIGWHLAAVACCTLGMGCKAVMVTAPLMVLLYDWVFLSQTPRQLIRKRWSLYVGLAATWSVPWLSGIAGGVLSPSSEGAHVGFGYKGITPVEYGLTQFSVLVKYLSLSLWPRPLCLDYNWPVVRSIGEALPAAAVVAFLLGATVWGIIRKSWLGFLGGWFFLILAPTSSIIPIKDPLFEHRMYLPLAAVVTLAVFAGYSLLQLFHRRVLAGRPVRPIVAVVIAGAIVLALGAGTLQRNRDYHTAVSMWRDVAVKRPGNARAFEQLGTALVMEGRKRDAIEAYREAVRIDPDFSSAHVNLANALTQMQRFEEAVYHYNRTRELDPYHVDARLNLGHALDMLGRTAESIEAYREATLVDPRHTRPQVLARAHYNLGSALGRAGDLDAAVHHYNKALLLEPLYDKAHFSLGWVLSLQGNLEGAIEHFEQTLRIDPSNEPARQALEDVRQRQRRGDRD